MNPDREPQAAFAFELMHGAHLVSCLLDTVIRSATPALQRDYPALGAALRAADDALYEFYQQCGKAWSAETEREEHMHPDGLRAALRVATPGLCTFCEEPLPEGQRVICRSPDCKRAYHSAYGRDRPERQKKGEGAK